VQNCELLVIVNLNIRWVCVCVFLTHSPFFRSEKSSLKILFDLLIAHRKKGAKNASPHKFQEPYAPLFFQNFDGKEVFSPSDIPTKKKKKKNYLLLA